MLAPAIAKINSLIPPEEDAGVDYAAMLKAADDELDAEGWGRCEIIDTALTPEPEPDVKPKQEAECKDKQDPKPVKITYD